MENNPNVSIVVPVYNLEKYLRQCVESIVLQNQTAMDVILVDDGSKDGSPPLCDALAEQYPQVRVIHKENAGAADSRNVGILAATADTVMFVDGDDFLPAHAVDKVMAAKKADTDILTIDFYEYYAENQIEAKKHLNIDTLVGQDRRSSAATFSTVSPLPMPWLYAIRKAFLLEHQILMHKGLLDEDEEWTARLFAHRPTVELLAEPLYYYRRNREASLTYGRTIRNTKADIKIICLLQNEIHSGQYDTVGCRILENKCRQMVNKVLDDKAVLSAEEYRAVKREVGQYRALLKRGTRLDQIHYYLDLIIGRENCKKLIASLVKLKGK